MKLHIGCGLNYLEGYKNIDVSCKVKADEYYDIRLGVKEEDNSVDEIFASCVLEQICSNDDFTRVMNEFWRVLKPTGTLRGHVPNASLAIAFRDPMDCRYFTEETFDYFTKGHRLYERYGKIYGLKPWRVTHCVTSDTGIIHFTMHPVKEAL
ncbi:MAG: methyltransferase domain-containing protein [Candidatus Desulfofervidus sp.]|nr:methyltransferase domain-containing protein [Candidatus Desulfofervidus sp.]